jgi:hypothetical protein
MYYTKYQDSGGEKFVVRETGFVLESVFDTDTESCSYYLNFGPDNYVEITPEKFAEIRAWISRSEERES